MNRSTATGARYEHITVVKSYTWRALGIRKAEKLRELQVDLAHLGAGESDGGDQVDPPVGGRS